MALDEVYQEKNIPCFEAMYGKGLISLGEHAAIDGMVSGLHLAGKYILDVGSGIGGMAYHLAEHYSAHVIGLDVFPWMADYAQKNAPKDELVRSIENGKQSSYLILATKG